MVDYAKFIFKKIFTKLLIFFGVLFAFSLFSSCSKAYALELTVAHDFSIIEAQKNSLTASGNMDKIIDNRTNEFQWYVWRDITNNRIYYSNRIIANDMNNFYGVVFNGEYANFRYNNIGITFSKYSSATSKRSFIFLSEGDLPYIPNINATDGNSFNQWNMRSNTIVIDTTFLWNSFNIKPDPEVYYFEAGDDWYYQSSNYYYYDITDGNNDIYFRASQNWNLNLSGTKYSTKSFNLEYITPTISITQGEIIDLNNNGLMVTGYNVSAYFNPFNTNFKYTYQFNDSPELIINENNQIFNVNANGRVRFRVYDLNNNLLDYRDYYTTNVGNYISLNDDNISFTYIMSTNSDSDVDYIYTSEAVSIVFKNFNDDTFNYYYKFVPVNGNANDYDLINITENYYSKNYTENGTIYAYIYQGDTKLLEKTFEITKIGEETDFFSEPYNNSTTGKFFSTISDSINFGGPISDIINIPIEMLQYIVDNLGKTCQPASLGNLLGYELSIPCIDVESIVGFRVYATIDIILCIVIVMNLVSYFKNLYIELINLDYKPRHAESGRVGRNRGVLY